MCQYKPGVKYVGPEMRYNTVVLMEAGASVSRLGVAGFSTAD